MYGQGGSRFAPAPGKSAVAEVALSLQLLCAAKVDPGSGKKGAKAAYTGCRVSGYRLGLGCCGCPPQHLRGSGWAALALRRRLALGAATSTFYIPPGPRTLVRGPVSFPVA